MTLDFKYSDGLGDIIYSMPLVKQMAAANGRSANYFVFNDVPARLGKDVFHSNPDVMVNVHLLNYIQPLLATQSYISNISHISTAQVPPDALDLDRFKSSALNLKTGLIYGWYRKAFGVSFALEDSWLFVDGENAAPLSEKGLGIAVLVGRTTRFCNTRINYSFLDQTDNVGFIGLDY